LKYDAAAAALSGRPLGVEPAADGRGRGLGLSAGLAETLAAMVEAAGLPLWSVYGYEGEEGRRLAAAAVSKTNAVPLAAADFEALLDRIE
jgi:hypothetical protein